MHRFSSIFVDFEVPGNLKVMKVRGKVDRRGKGRLGAQKNEANRVNETPERSPGMPKVRFMGGQGAPKIIGLMASVLSFGARGCPIKYLST